LEVLINSKTDVEHEIEIVVAPQELLTHFEKAYREEGKNLVLPGFRRGKIPLQLIKKRFGEAIEYKVIEKLSNDFFKQALEERDIKPVGQPVLQDMNYKPGNELVIKINYETLPIVVAQDYKGLQLEHLQHEVTDDEVEDEILQLQKNNRNLEDAEIADDDGFLVTCDIQMLDENGKPKLKDKNEGIKIDLDDENVNRDLKAELLNMTVGEEKDVELTFENRDGKEEVEKAHIKVTKIQKIILPELDDTFVLSITKERLKSLDELRLDIRKHLVDSWEKRYEEQLNSDLISEIVKRNPFAVPQSIVGEVLDDMVEQLKQRYQDSKLPEGFDIDGYRKSRTEEARFISKWMFVRENIIEQEGVTLEDEDIEAKVSADAEKMGIAKENLMQYYKSNPQISQSILVDKLLTRLREYADIKKIDDDDISHTPIAPLHTHDHSHDQIHDHVNNTKGLAQSEGIDETEFLTEDQLENKS